MKTNVLIYSYLDNKMFVSLRSQGGYMYVHNYFSISPPQIGNMPQADSFIALIYLKRRVSMMAFPKINIMVFLSQ